MLPSFSRGLRLALVLALSVGYVAWHGHSQLAFAKGGGDEEEGGGGDDDSGDDDSGAKTTDDEGDGGEEDKDQPPVTAGGLFTLNSYPVSEILRPLTMTQKIMQLRLGLGTDLSAKGAFESFGVSLEGTYGLSDNFSIIGGLTDQYTFAQFSAYFGFEGSLAYDMLDIRLAANLHRFAVPILETVTSGDPPVTTTLPGGKYNSTGPQFSVDLGFPFRYAIKPEIAIIALQTLITFDFNAGKDKDGNEINKIKPDLNPSVGIATNPIPALSLVVFGQLRILDFDTSAANFQIPVTARVEFSPSQKFDIGLEFTLLNIKPPEGQSPIDNRFLNLFIQSRFGK
ncbi:MAG: hypothetical protein ABIY55_03685 [Kofleriaceae bacterium]